MPGWHAATSQLRDSGRLLTAGVALEQHPDRTRLFMQWQEMTWPVLWDPFNILGFKVVPVTYLVNPDGLVVAVQPSLDRVDEIGQRILAVTGSSRPGSEPFRPRVFGPELTGTPPDESDLLAWSDHAAALAIWEPGSLDRAVAVARTAAEDSDYPVFQFRLGVTLRMRFDSEQRHPGDFAATVAAWSEALSADPNQYIWRRRLQQYGPRLAKPYPFYDWVPSARQEITSRGESPVELAVEPHGAEYAAPADHMASASHGLEPDRHARVTTDEERLLEVETVLIPPRPGPGEGVRLHLILTPNHTVDAHWNNEAGHGEVWIEPPSGWEIDQRHQLLPIGPSDVSDEIRHIECELVVPEDARTGGVISGHLLYYVCEGASGTCLYRRRDLRVPVEISLDQDLTPLAG